MNFNNLLNQILGTVQKSGKSVSDSPLNSFGGGALVGGLASMLMKKKTAKSLVKVGSVAALGYLAYQGYQNWQKNKQQEAVPQGAFEPPVASLGTGRQSGGKLGKTAGIGITLCIVD